MRWVRKLRTWLGRLDRDIGRKIAGNAELEAAFVVARERVARVLAQKAGDSDKLYALHAPEVERSEEHTSELQSLMRISYAVFCLQKNKKQTRMSQRTSIK